MDLPSYIQIEPVGRCNLRCQMCAIQFRQDAPPALMQFEVFTQLIDRFTTLKTLHLQGLGEPMMHPQFFEMVKYATEKNIQVTTNSNLTLLTAKDAEQCVTSGLNCLHVSIDGATPDTYERIRVGASFDRVTHHLERLIETRKRLNSEYPRLRLVMVIMRQNLQELPALVKLAHQWEVEGFFVQHLCHDFGESSLPDHYKPMRDFVESETLLNEDIDRVEYYFNQARAIAQSLNLELRLPRTRPRPHPPTTSGKARCDWVWRGAYISYQGLAMPCCMVSTPDRINFGHWLDQGIEQTWNGTEYEQFREQLASETPPEVCQSCSVYSGTF